MEYGLSKEMSKTDDRQPIWKQQRKERGFDNTELWSFDHTLAKFIKPRLEVFKENVTGCTPGSFESNDDWMKELDKMILCFTHIVNGEVYKFDEVKHKEIDDGLESFHKNFFNLWY